MNSKVISILTLVLISKLIECQDICKLIQTDGKYKGLAIYNRFYYTNESRSYVMHTKDKEWFFEITGTNPKVALKDMKMKMIRNSVKDNPFPEAYIRFGLYLEQMGFLPDLTYDCRVFEEPGHKWKLNYDEETKNRKLNKTTDMFPNYDNFVVLKPDPAFKSNFLSDRHILVVNKTERRNAFRYNIRTFEFWKLSAIPSFITQMDVRLFRQIEAVLDFDTDGKSGYLVLFNIRGRPKYCFTYKNDISSECNSSDKMEYLFKECFQTGLTPQTLITTSVTLRTTTESSWNRNIRYIAFITVIAVILLIIVVISGLVCLKKWRKKRPIPKKTSSTPSTQKQTHVSSVKTTESDKSSKTSKVLPPKPKTQSN